MIGTFEKRAQKRMERQYPFRWWQGEIYGRGLSFQEFWSWISDEPPSFSLKTGTKAHTQNMAKWPRVKLKKNYVGKESSGSFRR